MKTGTKTGIGTGAGVKLSRRSSVHLNQMLIHDQVQIAGFFCKFFLCCLEVLTLVIVVLVSVKSSLHSYFFVPDLFGAGLSTDYLSFSFGDSWFFPPWLLYKDVKHRGRVLGL